MNAWLRERRRWTLIGLGVLAMALLIALGLERRSHIATERELVETILAKQQVEARLSAEERRASQLAQALESKAKEVERVVRRLEEEAHTVERLQDRMAKMEGHVSQLQAELVLAIRAREELPRRKARRWKSETVELEKITVSGPRPKTIEGKILQVEVDWAFIVVDLGWDLLAVGDMLGVYRGEELIAKVQVERVQEKAAAARILPDYEAVEIAMEDRVAEL